MTEFYLSTNANDEPVYCASIKGMSVYNPHMSECGRFAVKPSYYGLTDADVKALAYLNKINNYNTEV
jgi:hypothetical protein